MDSGELDDLAMRPQDFSDRASTATDAMLWSLSDELRRENACLKMRFLYHTRPPDPVDFETARRICEAATNALLEAECQR